MAQIISKKRVDPRARTASDFDIQANPPSQSPPKGGWQEYASAKDTARTAETKGATKFPITVGFAILAAAVLGSVAIYTLIPPPVTNADDLKNQQYISSLQVSIVALKAAKEKVEAALQDSIVALKAEKAKVEPEKAKVEADKKAACRILSSAKKSISATQKKCDPSNKDVCSNLPVIRDSDIQRHCGAQTN